MAFMMDLGVKSQKAPTTLSCSMAPAIAMPSQSPALLPATPPLMLLLLNNCENGRDGQLSVVFIGKFMQDGGQRRKEMSKNAPNKQNDKGVAATQTCKQSSRRI
jgi:hypothetical protein